MKTYSMIALGTISLAIAAWFFLKTPSSSIETIQSFSEVNWEKITPRSLIIFDIDDVLVMPKDAIYQTSDSNTAFRNQLFSTLAPQLGLSKKDILDRKSLYLKLGEKKLIESSILTIIHDLQGRGIQILGLTNSPTGTLGLIPSMENWRVESLKNIGIDFSNSFSNIASFYFIKTDFLGDNGSYPLFDRGLLITNGISKGKTLFFFLDHIGLKPSEIVFFDDNRAYLQDVSAAASQNGIIFKGFQYKGMEHNRTPLNKDIATKQLTHLIKDQIWLTDEQAAKED